MDRKDVWVVVLAAAERPRQGSGESSSPPVAYRPVLEGRSPLCAALERGKRLVPAERVLLVVSESHRQLWTEEVRATALPSANVLTQPLDRGSAVEALLGLLAVGRRQPDGQVVILPANHAVEDEETLSMTIDRGLRESLRWRDQVILLGTPRVEDSGHDWLVAASDSVGLSRALDAILRRPSGSAVTELQAHGALCDVGVRIARVGALVATFERACPGVLRAFGVHQKIWDGWNPWVTDALYQVLPALDWVGDVLGRSVERLRVLPLPPCGWAEVGRTRARQQERGHPVSGARH